MVRGMMPQSIPSTFIHGRVKACPGRTRTSKSLGIDPISKITVNAFGADTALSANSSNECFWSERTRRKMWVTEKRNGFSHEVQNGNTLTGRSLSFDWISFGHPVGTEICRQVEQSETLETQFL